MMTQKQPHEEKFLALLQRLYSASVGDDPLKSNRTKAWERFNTLELPSKATESYKYIKLRNLFTKDLTLPGEADIAKENILPYVYPECLGSHLVFVNGRFSQELSVTKNIAPNVVAAPLSVAARTYGSFLNNRWTKALKEENDPFAAVNRALQREGLFIYVPPNTCVETPIQILYIAALDDTLKLVTPHTQVFVGKGAEIKVYASLASLSGDDYMINQLTDFTLDEEAHASFVHSAVNHHNKAWHFDAVRATLKRNSTFKSINVNEGEATYRNDYHITLLQENCEVELDGVWMLSDKKESHAHVLVDHQAPHCRSRQLFKGVLRDVSRSSFEGKILVRQAAQKTDAFQLNKNLILDERAHADSKPNLEIFADDVKASHGSTVGRIDQEALFYMRSRGIHDVDAKNILIYSFCKEVIDRISLPSLYEALNKKAQSFLYRK